MKLADELVAHEDRAARIRGVLLGLATLRDQGNALLKLPRELIDLLRREPLNSKTNLGDGHGSREAVDTFRNLFAALRASPDAPLHVDYPVVKPRPGSIGMRPEMIATNAAPSPPFRPTQPQEAARCED